MKNLSRPLVYIDTETTGLNPQQDRIITLAIEQHLPGVQSDFPVQCEWKFNPGIPIPEEVTKIHGITNTMVKSWPPFRDHVDTILKDISGCDFAGFNTIFDLQMLHEEVTRCGKKFDFSNSNILDVGMIYKKKHPRTLSAAVQEYLGVDHDGAHGAMQDVIATRMVMEAMLQFHEPLAEMSLGTLSYYSMCDDKDGSVPLDLAGTIRKRRDGVVVFGTKRNKDVPVVNDPGYAGWMLRSDFPEQTKQVIRRILEPQPELVP